MAWAYTITSPFVFLFSLLGLFFLILLYAAENSFFTAKVTFIVMNDVGHEAFPENCLADTDGLPR